MYALLLRLKAYQVQKTAQKVHIFCAVFRYQVNRLYKRMRRQSVTAFPLETGNRRSSALIKDDLRVGAEAAVLADEDKLLAGDHTEAALRVRLLDLIAQITSSFLRKLTFVPFESGYSRFT